MPSSLPSCTTASWFQECSLEPIIQLRAFHDCYAAPSQATGERRESTTGPHETAQSLWKEE